MCITKRSRPLVPFRVHRQKIGVPRRRKRRDPAVRGSSRHLLDRYAELPRLVDEVLGDAAAGECDDALGQEIQELVVAPERSGPSVAVPVGLADDLVDAALVGPACRDVLDAGAAAVDEDHVGVTSRIPYAGALTHFPT